ncbi:5-oxoprolinase subunit C family protein [Salegentibacter chungangensis]|uniref:Biotin-dependent carboxyltransferase family protein n=1 Tax=Salegentibacter chungangensis TaxID=1335724 RepID=A0ABW3NU23_9FLAO
MKDIMAEVEVLHPGLFSTIQDSGRTGFREYGVPVSGAMDKYAAKTANLILQNQADAAVLEITQMGPKLKFGAPAKIAISGANLSPEVNGKPVENNEVIKIEAGDILAFGKRELGCRCYLAVKQGFRSPKVLESRSWYEGLTDHYRLEKGMTLSYRETQKEKYETHSSLKFSADYLATEEIEVYPGPEFKVLSETQKLVLRESYFSISRNNNRMAIQLQETFANELEPIITGPVLPGTVQLTPGGKLIVLMRDCQTTGGYPRILQLSEYAVNAIAQKIQGDAVKFNMEAIA